MSSMEVLKAMKKLERGLLAYRFVTINLHIWAQMSKWSEVRAISYVIISWTDRKINKFMKERKAFKFRITSKLDEKKREKY